MSDQTILLICALAWVAIVAWAAAFWRASNAHRAKAEVYEEFARTFRDLGDVVWMRESDRKKAESAQRFMRMALIDPAIRDGLRSALEKADEYWAKRGEVW